MTLENAVINNGGLKQYASSVVLKSGRCLCAISSARQYTAIG